MPKVSINILTKNRAGLLKKALASVFKQSFQDYEIVVVNDGSTDNTNEVLSNFQFSTLRPPMAESGGQAIFNFQIINHKISKGITVSRQEALITSSGEYVAILDDDDEWVDSEKLVKQVKFLDENKDCVLVGGGIIINPKFKNQNVKFRPKTDEQIRKTMLLRNNFFTSTVMFRKEEALKAGGFVKDQDDFAEDYDLWLRFGKMGKMWNIQEPFTLYCQPNYNKARFKSFLAKQLRLISLYKNDYPRFWIAKIIFIFRLLF